MEHPSLSLSRGHGATSLLLAVPGLGLTAQPSKPQALSQVPSFLNSPPPKKINPIFKLPGSCQTLPRGANPAVALAAPCVFSSEFGASPARREPESHGSLKVTAGFIDGRRGENQNRSAPGLPRSKPPAPPCRHRSPPSPALESAAPCRE